MIINQFQYDMTEAFYLYNDTYYLILLKIIFI